MVGEYEIVILSATEATSLETWLTNNAYNIPEGAAPLFEQYIQQGMYFFVAKVNPAEVTFEDGQAVLSPLRFHYTSDTFSLPIRLGMINSAGSQDLLVYLLGQGTRYEVANYPNAIISTNLNVKDEVRQDFPAFYEKIFTRARAETPNAVVTEYAWGASNCDPCPIPALNPDELATLGGDVAVSSDEFGGKFLNYTVTRLHARYGKSDLSEDLVFQEAKPLQGGRGTAGVDQAPTTVDEQGWMHNQFQGRYIIHNRFGGAMDCAHPVRGRWTAPPPEGMSSAPSTAPGPNTGGQVAGDSLVDKSIAQLEDAEVPETGQPLYVDDCNRVEFQWGSQPPESATVLTPQEFEQMDIEREEVADADAIDWDASLSNDGEAAGRRGVGGGCATSPSGPRAERCWPCSGWG